MNLFIITCRSDKDASSRWYYWKVKPEEATHWSRLFVWVGYSLHNLSVWFVLYLQHRSKVSSATFQVSFTYHMCKTVTLITYRPPFLSFYNDLILCVKKLKQENPIYFGFQAFPVLFFKQRVYSIHITLDAI